MLVPWVELCSATRYYDVSTGFDVLGERVVQCVWGGRLTARHGSRTYPVATAEEAKGLIDTIMKQRLRRGYVIVNGEQPSQDKHK